MPDVTYHCQSEHHEGDRLIAGHNGFTARLDYRSLDGKDRPHSTTLRVVCFGCMELEWALVEGGVDETVPMFS